MSNEPDTDAYFDGGNYSPPWGEPFADEASDDDDRKIDEARDADFE